MIEIKVYLKDKLLQKATLSGKTVSVGRSDDNDVVIPDKLISRRHIVLEKKEGRYFISDLSTNGTFLNDNRVKDPSPIPDECTVQIPPYELKCTAFSDEVTVPQFTLSKEDTGDPVVPPSYTNTEHLHFGLLVGDDPLMKKVYDTVRRVGDSPVSVLIRGESGTGKELVAKAIHSLSSRRKAPFVALDCAAIPETLIESELFGFEKGAFTGAASSKKGWFEEAEGGTIFLDEIGELSIPAQAKLLRFLQDKTYTRLGGNRILKANVRLITATNKDLEEAIQANEFRSDLYFRLRVVQVLLPPLRDRKGDIPLLADHILSRIAKENKLPRKPIITTKALSKLQAGDWPGNVRQLENVLYNGFISAPPPHLIDEEQIAIPQNGYEAGSLDRNAQEPPTFDDVNKQFLLTVLKDCNWDTAKAAKVLKVSRGTIYYKSKKLGINIKELAK
jgi:Nif-specific regulatory protein